MVAQRVEVYAYSQNKILSLLMERMLNQIWSFLYQISFMPYKRRPKIYQTDSRFIKLQPKTFVSNQFLWIQIS